MNYYYVLRSRGSFGSGTPLYVSEPFETHVWDIDKAKRFATTKEAEAFAKQNKIHGFKAWEVTIRR